MDSTSETFILLASFVVEVHQCQIIIDWETLTFNILGDTEEKALECAEELSVLTYKIMGPMTSRLVLSES